MCDAPVQSERPGSVSRQFRTAIGTMHTLELGNSVDCGLWQVSTGKSLANAIYGILDGVTNTTIGQTDERFSELAREVRYVISGSSNHTHADLRDCKARLHSSNDFRMFPCKRLPDRRLPRPEKPPLMGLV